MTTGWTVSFAPEVGDAERAAVRDLLAAGREGWQPFQGHRRGVKQFYLAQTPAGRLFIKVRPLRSWTQRLGRTLRAAKAETEFHNLLALRRRGIPCPTPVAVARRRHNLLVCETMLIERFLDGAAPLRQLLVERPQERAAILDDLAAFLLALRDSGVVHADLQWNNILVRPGPAGPDAQIPARRDAPGWAGREFHLVDALHVRLVPQPDRAAFGEALAWFVAFMMAEGAAREVVEEFLDRLPRLGLDRQADRRDVAERARRLALQLCARPSYERFKGRYDSPRAAAEYRDERFTRSRRWRRIDRREQELVGRFLCTLPAGAWLLDLPCGAGRLAPLVRQAGLRYVGADVSPEMVRLARQAGGEPGCVLAADGTSLPFADGTFEAALCVRLMHRIVEREARVAILRELARVARRRILVSYYRRGNWRGVGKWLRGRFPGLTLADIYEDAGEAGLRVVSAAPLGRWTEQQWFFVLERCPEA